MDLGLADKVYVLTGASKGLGYATARALVDDGARVVLSSRDADRVAAAAAGLGGDERAVGVPADLADPDAARRLVDTAMARYGRLDGALVSVGGPPPGTAAGATDEQWRAAFENVFLGAVRITRTVATALAGSGGSGGEDAPREAGAIGLVLSTSARSPIPGLGISNGLRPGLAMVVKDMADEYGSRGVRLFGLLPGRIATDRMVQLDAGDAGVARAARAAIPLGRYGTPDEFGRTAAFLLSPAAGYVTGSLVAVDGGALRSL